MSESEKKESKIEEEKDKTVEEDSIEVKITSNNVTNHPKPTSEILVASENASSSQSQSAEDDSDAEADSEAETLIQSPEKKRSLAEFSNVVHQLKMSTTSDTGSVIVANTSDKENATRKRKRSNDNDITDLASRTSSHRSSPLSSPMANPQSDIDSEEDDRARSTTPARGSSDQVSIDKISSKRRRRRPSELTAPPSHKRSKRGSLDNTERRETRSATYPRQSDDENSVSAEPPPRREHRRGASTQVTPHEFERRKRGRPPIIKTGRNRSAERASDTSDNESEPTARNRPPLHKFTSNDHDIMSPVKVGPRKWKDKNGRTYLARACASEDLDLAKDRLVQRPQDLNMEDNAGNTPLQIASLEGFESIVEFLLSKGADVNVRNIDKDTPLIDAIDNGHVEVVRLLLKYGANPRMANAKGEQPLDRVPDDDEHADAIKKLLKDTLKKDLKKTPGVDLVEHHNHERASSRAASAASPRESPPIGPKSPPISESRRRTGRSESTRKDLLWTANTQENLIKLAEEGDVQGVASILAVLEKAETESLIAAAKAGHENVLQLLIGLGNPNPDPQPIRGPKIHPGSNTPMLAAIGRGHLDVVKLLANQSGFNPTRKYKDRTYFELAEDRQGDKWEEEFEILRQAYNEYAVRNGKKPSSPRRSRDMERPRSGLVRRSSSVKSARKQMSSPETTHKPLPKKTSDVGNRERRKLSDPSEEKRRSSGNVNPMDASVAVGSDADLTVANQKKVHRTRRSQSDLPPLPVLESELTHKRRRLVTGREHRSRHTISTSSDNEELDAVEVKQEERSQPVLKRSRVSSTPEPVVNGKEDRMMSKKRRTVLESSPDEARSRPNSLVENNSKNSTKDAKIDGDTSMTNAAEEEVAPPVPAQEPQSEENQTVKRESPQPEIDTSAVPKAPANETFEQPVLKPVDTHEESDDPYSPPPAEPFDDTPSKEAEQATADAIKQAAMEEQARQEKERLEQIEREERIAQEKAAEEARKQQEAEAMKKAEEEAELARQREESERQERIRQEAEIRKQAEQAAEERKRINTLPLVLAKTAEMIDENDVQVKRLPWLNHFLPLYSVSTHQLDPNCGSEISLEEWVPDFQVASLLGTKDLNLRSFTFEKQPVTEHQRMCLWRVSRTKLSYDLPPNWVLSVDRALDIERTAEEKFKTLSELFWIKLSDFINHVPQIPHLKDINLSRQPISLKSLLDITGPRMKTSNFVEQYSGLANGTTMNPVHTNGENGIV